MGRRRQLSHLTRLRLLMLPYTLGIILLVFLPAVVSLGLAFYQYDALTPPVWSGNLSVLLAYTDELFFLSIQNMLALILLPVPLRVAGAFLLAVLWRHRGRWSMWGRTAVYLPTVIPGTAYALIWLWVLNPLYGPLNLLLMSVGITPPHWLADGMWAKPGLALISLWQLGEGFIICLAALQDLPPNLEDAARIDGAGPRQILRYILLPLIAPVLLLLAFRDAILMFEISFVNVLMTTGGGPYYATYTLPLFIYEQGFDLLAFGTASVGLWVMYLLTGLVVILLYIVARQWDVGITDEQFFV